MVTLFDKPMYLLNGQELLSDTQENRERIAAEMPGEGADKTGAGTIANAILSAHNAAGNAENLKLKFDAMASHDITFVGIVQTAKVSGLDEFPLPYVLTNCHNSLCAVGGTINEDDHMFGLSAARRYGGVYVPPHLTVIHSYMREAMAGCGKMILGSDSHTRYGALGTMAVGEGGGELVKQLLCQTYDMPYPNIVGVHLTGKPLPGVGPQDVALAIIGAVFTNGLAKNCVLEFVGDGIDGLSADYRCGIDVMTTETTCWSSIWKTDDVIRDYLALHGRAEDYKPLAPAKLAKYDAMIQVDLTKVRPMIALPFHPSNTYTIEELNANLGDILRKVEKEAAEILENADVPFNLTNKIENGRLRVDQGVIAGCAGGIYSNIMVAANILKGKSTGNGAYSLSVYPASQPVMLEIAKNGAMATLIEVGATVRTAFCGPCFGAGDVPANNALSIRHTTRNFPNREGSKPMNGQISSVALMDARSIAATSISGGLLTPATDLHVSEEIPAYNYDDSPYKSRVYNGIGKALRDTTLQYGPNIVDWPSIPALGENLLVKVVTYITDPVTTTDEIIPSGETSSYRSNPMGLAEFTFSRKDPAYVGRAKEVHVAELARAQMASGGQTPEEVLPELALVMQGVRSIAGMEGISYEGLSIGSAVFAVKPGDGSAREQAASCQRVLGGAANFANEYATKRYRSNLINWGLVPFVLQGTPPFENGDYVFVPNMAKVIMGDTEKIKAYAICGAQVKEFVLSVAPLTQNEKEIVRQGCLINYNKALMQAGK